MGESGCPLEHPKASAFRSHVIAGEWDEVSVGQGSRDSWGSQKGDELCEYLSSAQKLIQSEYLSSTQKLIQRELV